MGNKQLFEKQSNQYNPFFPIVRLGDIIDTISDKSIQWILNNYNHIYVEYSESKAVTRNKVPQLLRRTGLWVSYNAGTEVVTEYYKGDNKDVTNFIKWTNDDNWERFDKIKHLDGSITYQHLSESLRQLIGQGNNITNFPDDEDLEVKDGLLKLKDRDFEPNNFSGLGRVILRKNIKAVDGQPKNVLTQDMINKENTIYEIRYDFDLNGQEIIIPEDCVLDFQGGILKNGTIILQKTYINAENKSIFGDVKIKGSSLNKHINAIWFKFFNPQSTTNALILNKYIIPASANLGLHIYIPKGVYEIESTIYAVAGLSGIVGDKLNRPTLKYVGDGTMFESIPDKTSSTNYSFGNILYLKLEGTNKESQKCLSLEGWRYNVENLDISHFRVGMILRGVIVKCEKLLFHNNSYGIIIAGLWNSDQNNIESAHSTMIHISNCMFQYNGLALFTSEYWKTLLNKTYKPYTDNDINKGQSLNIQIEKCDFEQNYQGVVITSVIIGKLMDCWFEGNTIESVIGDLELDSNRFNSENYARPIYKTGVWSYGQGAFSLKRNAFLKLNTLEFSSCLNNSQLIDTNNTRIRPYLVNDEAYPVISDTLNIQNKAIMSTDVTSGITLNKMYFIMAFYNGTNIPVNSNLDSSMYSLTRDAIGKYTFKVSKEIKAVVNVNCMARYSQSPVTTFLQHKRSNSLTEDLYMEFDTIVINTKNENGEDSDCGSIQIILYTKEIQKLMMLKAPTINFNSDTKTVDIVSNDEVYYKINDGDYKLYDGAFNIEYTSVIYAVSKRNDDISNLSFKICSI